MEGDYVLLVLSYTSFAPHQLASQSRQLTQDRLLLASFFACPWHALAGLEMGLF